MKTTSSEKTGSLSVRTKSLFAMQGYVYYSSAVLKNMMWGIKLPYLIIAIMMVVAMVFKDMGVLAKLTAMSVGGMLLPRHPVDYLYNLVMRKWMGKPKLPKRTKQARFGFFVQALFIGTIMVLMMNNMSMMASMMGYMVIFFSSLMVVLDISMASIFYNLIRFGSMYPQEWSRMRIMMRKS